MPVRTDASRIYCQLHKAVEAAGDKEVVRNLDLNVAVEQIVTGEVRSAIVDEAYLVVYSVGSPWYAPHRTLVGEQMVLKIGKGSFQSVVDFLDLVAQEYDADAIVTGGALSANPVALARLYQRYGFTNDNSPTLVKRR